MSFCVNVLYELVLSIFIFTCLTFILRLYFMSVYFAFCEALFEICSRKSLYNFTLLIKHLSYILLALYDKFVLVPGHWILLQGRIHVSSQCEIMNTTEQVGKAYMFKAPSKVYNMVFQVRPRGNCLLYLLLCMYLKLFTFHIDFFVVFISRILPMCQGRR